MPIAALRRPPLTLKSNQAPRRLRGERPAHPSAPSVRVSPELPTTWQCVTGTHADLISSRKTDDKFAVPQWRVNGFLDRWRLPPLGRGRSQLGWN